MDKVGTCSFRGEKDSPDGRQAAARIRTFPKPILTRIIPSLTKSIFNLSFCPVEARLHSLFHVPSEPETEGEEGKGGEEAEEGKVQEFRCEVLGMGGRLHQQPSRKVA